MFAKTTGIANRCQNQTTLPNKNTPRAGHFYFQLARRLFTLDDFDPRHYHSTWLGAPAT
ncbi:hypothetical protein LP414_23160 [Polaromonas sp. P1(28)-13]|nr:hypothetical protein LP417_06685 [Polaromonas sp. P1-6]UUZ67318.1 hypothetical protein LP416_21365 [Polaromonas sp. P2-4]UUZ74983.1 hypothetical protein LP414_23160 [Polaromonas sp. P1(28)-13]